MMDIARDQSTKIVGIFPRSSTATVMQKEPHAVHVFEDSGTLRPGRLSRQLARLDLFGAAIRIEPRQLRHLPPVHLRRGESQLLFKRLLQHRNVPVFAEHQRNHDPVVARAHLAVRSPVSQEFPFFPETLRPRDGYYAWSAILRAGSAPLLSRRAPRT